ncbi:hypothetical protein CVT24_012552 [Panaeolus cyanescens]|uniref:Uncharacterized protein n=1 Tax=Panaeolus cyanescens TaxID=181874 RepID=A0A409W605_9AGAR|nr:hypothetical protein CVT24_012552 [Panaeolus cyanescens]
MQADVSLKALLEVEWLFLSNLSPRELVLWAKVSRRMRDGVHTFVTRAYDVSRLLSHHGIAEQDVWSFRYLQRFTGLVISGPTAVQFFTRQYSTKSTLDLFVESRYAMRVVHWMTIRGFGIKGIATKTSRIVDWSKFRQNGYTLYDEAVVVMKLTKGQSKVQIISSFLPPLALILQLESTALHNVITGEKAICIHPQAMHARKSFMLNENQVSLNTYDRERMKKWLKTQGYSTFPLTASDSTVSRYIIAGTRRLGDPFCWSIDLPPLPVSNCNVLEKNGFEIVDVDGEYYVIFQVFTGLYTKFFHVFPPTQSRYRPYESPMDKSLRESLEKGLSHMD